MMRYYSVLVFIAPYGPLSDLHTLTMTKHDKTLTLFLCHTNGDAYYSCSCILKQVVQCYPEERIYSNPQPHDEASSFNPLPKKQQQQQEQQQQNPRLKH